MTQRTLIFLAGLLWAAGASAQTTRVRGQVTDAADGKPLQFVSVVFPGTTTGITTDEQGIYALETRDTVSRVQASMVGYATSKPWSSASDRWSSPPVKTPPTPFSTA